VRSRSQVVEVWREIEPLHDEAGRSLRLPRFVRCLVSGVTASQTLLRHGLMNERNRTSGSAKDPSDRLCELLLVEKPRYFSL